MNVDILRLIKEDEDALANKEGIKPLITLAEQLQNAEPDNITEVERQLLAIPLQELSLVQINSLISFLHYAGVGSKTVSAKIVGVLKNSFLSRDDEDVLKRSLLLRFVAESSADLLSVEKVLSEELVRQKFPWAWIDIVHHYSWSIAAKQIGKQFSDGDEIKNLIVRLPSYAKRIDKTKLIEACLQWHSNISNPKERALLEKWTSVLGIKKGISILAENGLRRISLYQKPLL